MATLDGKVAVVTGGGRGLGKAIALAFGKAGADVAVCSRTMEQLEQVAAEIRSDGRRAVGIEVDVSDSKSVRAMVDRTLVELGAIDILVNSAGVGWAERVVEMSDETFDWVIRTNLNGTFYCCREVARGMMDQNRGSIINIASVAGLKGPPGLAAYAASKGGILAFTRSLALELIRNNVRVNAIAPGYFRTDLNAAAFDDPEIGPRLLKRIPMRRAGRPEEIGPLAVYLASDDASFVTGETYGISGGELAQ